MTRHTILRWPDPRLTTVCDPVGEIDEDVVVLVQDMLDTMYAAPGRGLAAPQIGVMRRVFVTDTEWKGGTKTPIVFINPEIAATSEARAVHSEGCLSLPGVSADVTRPAEVTLSWKNLDGAQQHRSFVEFAAACVQHELDHLNGILTLDRLRPNERTRIEHAYAGLQS